jgi:hypothetical protein
METNTGKDTPEEAKGIISFPPRNVIKTFLHSTKKANTFLLIMEVLSKGTTTLKPEMNQVPLIREMLKEGGLAVGE